MSLPRTVEDAVGYLRRCDSLPFPSRMQALAVAARALTNDVFGQLHAILDAGATADRHTGLFLAVARRDLDRVEAALGDRHLQARAIAAAARLPVGDDALTRLVMRSPFAVRRDVYGVLRRSRRRGLADRLLPQIADRFGDADAAALLPACSPPVTEEWLPRLTMPPGALRTLARTAPMAVARLLAAEYAAHGQPHRWAPSVRRITSVLTRRSSQAGLLLLEQCPQLMTGEATAALLSRPRDFLGIVRRQGLSGIPLPARRLSRTAEHAVRRLSPGEIGELSAACETERVGWWSATGIDIVDPLLAMLEPADRRRIVGKAVAGVRRVHRMPVAQLAALAPSDCADLLLPVLQRETRDFPRTRLLALLPLPEVEDRLLADTGSHRHTVRELAWPSLLACAQRHGDPGAYARILGLAERAWHDREPVRTAALAQAARTPARLSHAVPIRVLRDSTLTTVQSADSSSRTFEALSMWLQRTVEAAAAGQDAARAGQAMLLLVKAMTDRRSGRVTTLRVAPAAATAIWEAVETQVAGPDEVVAAGRLLRHHLPTLPRLDDMLAEVWGKAAHPASPAAARLWVDAPATRDARAGIVATEGSAAAVETILPIVATRRTDLVDVLLDRAASGDAVSEPWIRAVPVTAPDRWLPQQSRRWQAMLAQLAGDGRAPLATRTAAAERITDVGELLTLCRSDAQPVVAAVLATLAHTAPPEQAMTELLTAAPLAGARGRAAMAGVRRLIARIPESQAVAACRRVLLDGQAGVGARKGAARAVIQVPSPDVRDVLIIAWDLPELHRDVRATVAVGLLRWIDLPETAARLSNYLTDAAIRDTVLGASHTSIPPAVRTGYANFVVRALSHPDPTVMQAACTAYARWLRVDPTGLDRVAELVAAATTTGRTWQICYDILVSQSDTTGGRNAWQAAVRGMTNPATAESRRRLTTLADAWHRLPATHIDTVVDALVQARLPRAAAQCAYLAALRALDAGEADPARWERYLQLVGNKPNRIAEPLRWHPTYSTAAATLEEDQVGVLVSHLEDAGSTIATLSAIDIVALVGRRARWPERWRQAILAWRKSTNPDIAEAAWLVNMGS